MSSKVAAFKGGLFLFLQQLLSRGLTFIASQVLLRFLTAEKLGLANRLDVYYLSIIFFARDSLRVAVQRQPIIDSTFDLKHKNENNNAKNRQRTLAQTSINLGYIAVPAGIIVSFIFGPPFLGMSTAELYFPLAIKLYTVGALIELAAEPFFAYLAAKQEFSARAAAESTGAVARCAATLATTYWAASTSWDAGLLPFAAGQLAYSVVLWAVYVLRIWPFARDEGFSMAPKGGLDEKGGKSGDGEFIGGLFHRPTMRLAASLQIQGIVKHFLTQGDTLIGALASAKAQGVYALANNYGGLVARLVFQPVEEMSRNYFGRLLAQDNQVDEKKKDDDKNNRKQALTKAASDLSTLLKVCILFSTVVVSIGPSAAPTVVRILAGDRWVADGASDTLANYCYYIPLLALNGLTEAFVSSVATEAQVYIQSVWMFIFTVIYASAGYFFLIVLDLPTSGLVFANIANMACRIIWCSWFINRFFREEGVPFDILSLKPGSVASVLCVAGPQLIRRIVSLVLPHGGNAFVVLAVTGVTAVPIAIYLALDELPLLKQLYTSFVRR